MVRCSKFCTQTKIKISFKLNYVFYKDYLINYYILNLNLYYITKPKSNKSFTIDY